MRPSLIPVAKATASKSSLKNMAFHQQKEVKIIIMAGHYFLMRRLALCYAPDSLAQNIYCGNNCIKKNIAFPTY